MAKPQPIEKPQVLKMRSFKGNVELRAEGEMETRTVKQSNNTTRQDRFFLSPSLGLGSSGSIYHPNLVIFDMDLTLGVGIQETTTTSSMNLAGPVGSRRETNLLQRYHANTVLLREKPYATTLFADKDIEFREYDFFGRVKVDTTDYGSHVGYTDGPIPVDLSLNHSTQEVSSLLRPSTSEEDRLSFNAWNERREGSRTDLIYSLDQFTRTETGIVGQPSLDQKGLHQMGNLFDLETLGADDSVQLNSSAFYNSTEQGVWSMNNLTAQEHLQAVHTKSLRSDYDYGYDTRQSGAVKSSGHHGRVQIRHDLYESLSSSLNVHGETSQDTDFERRAYGVGINENYHKRLAAWGSLTLGHSLSLDQEDRQASSGSLTIADESHTLTDGVVTLLSQPRVDVASIKVRDTTGVITYRENLDYRILGQGERTEIQRVFGGTILNGGSVRVSYSASGQGAGNFSTMGNRTHLRLDLFDGLVGLYARRNVISHQGGGALVLQDITDLVTGVDTSWRWIHAGAEYEDFRSNVGPYQAARLYQNFTFEPTEISTLTLNLNQTQTTWSNPTQKQMSYDVVLRHQIRLFSSMIWGAEGGYRVQQGRGFSQLMKTVRSDLDFSVGKFHMKAGYDFEDQDFSGNLLQRHFFFFQANRYF